jgi:hypothetical protein
LRAEPFSDTMESLMIEDLKDALRGLLRGTRFSQTKNNGPLFQRVTEDGSDESEGRLILAPVLLVDAEKGPYAQVHVAATLGWLKTSNPVRLQEL